MGHFSIHLTISRIYKTKHSFKWLALFCMMNADHIVFVLTITEFNVTIMIFKMVNEISTENSKERDLTSDLKCPAVEIGHSKKVPRHV